MPRKVVLGTDARQKILNGVNTLADAVKATLGPKGRNAVIEIHRNFPPVITKDGVRTAKSIFDLEDPYENMGCHILREAASKTSDLAGDGTTTSTVLAQAIYQKGLEYLAAGASPVALKRGIDKAVSVVVDRIKEIATPVSSDQDIVNIGTISANGDVEIGNLIARAMSEVGKDGIILMGQSNTYENILDVKDGMQLDRGFVAPHFATNLERQEAVLDNAYILVTERRITSMTAELEAAIEPLLRNKSPLLVIAGDFEAPFVVTLIENKNQGILLSVPVKAPGFGDYRKAALEDVAALTGAYAFTEDCGRKLDSITTEDLGRAERVVVNKDSTTITKGYGTTAVIEQRVTSIRSQLNLEFNDLDKMRLRQRLACLTSGIAIIKVGAATETELKEKSDRVEDAICATKAAVEEGIVPGGGKAYLLAITNVLKLVQTLKGDEQAGALIVRQVLESPTRQILTNAGLDAQADETIEKMRSGNLPFGYNASTDEYENLLESGVIDPAKVCRVALQNAASVASMLLTTDSMIATFPETK